MADFFQWLSSGSISATVFIAVTSILIVAVVAIYIVAFFQGREISFWPPKIGEKPVSKKQSDAKTTSRLQETPSDIDSESDVNRATVILANRKHMPQLRDILGKARKEIVLCAVQHTSLRHHGLEDLLREKAEAGCEVKILIMATEDADGKPNPNVAETESHRTYTGVKGEIETATGELLAWFDRLTKDTQKKIEIRAYQQCPITSYTIIDRGEPNGFIQTEVLIYGVAVDYLPHYTLTKREGGKLFSNHCESFKLLWGNAKIKILRPASKRTV